MTFIARNDGFVCDHCGQHVPPATATFRNHCPHCLHSKHVDGDTPGDRASHCGGLMQPVYIEVGGKKTDFTITHQCTQCGHVRKNRQQPDDNVENILAIQQQCVTKITHG